MTILEKIKILIIDDEQIAREKVIRYLQIVGKEIIIEEAENGFIGIEKINSFSPDIVLLDVEMPELNGIQMLYQIDNKNFEVIFQTAYPQFAAKAFEQDAVDYLVKPYSIERFIIAYEKVVNRINFKRENKTNKFYKKDIYEHLKKNKFYVEYFIIKAGNAKLVVSLDDVLYFKSEFHLTTIFWLDNTEKLRSNIYNLSLDKIQEKVDPEIFFRSDRSYLVRRTEIKSAFRRDNECFLKLKNGNELTISKSKFFLFDPNS